MPQNDPTDPDLIVCQLPDNLLIVTTIADCQSKGGQVVQKGEEPDDPAALFLFQGAHGEEVVGNYDTFLNRGGRLLQPTDRPNPKRPPGATRRVVCQLPNKTGVVTTAKACRAEGGKIVSVLPAGSKKPRA